MTRQYSAPRQIAGFQQDGNSVDSDPVCRKTCVLDCLEYASWHVHFALWALVWATDGLPVVRDGIGSRAPNLCGCAVLVVVDPDVDIVHTRILQAHLLDS